MVEETAELAAAVVVDVTKARLELAEGLRLILATLEEVLPQLALLETVGTEAQIQAEAAAEPGTALLPVGRLLVAAAPASSLFGIKFN